MRTRGRWLKHHPVIVQIASEGEAVFVLNSTFIRIFLVSIAEFCLPLVGWLPMHPVSSSRDQHQGMTCTNREVPWRLVFLIVCLFAARDVAGI